MRTLAFLIFSLLIFQTILILPDEVRKQFFLQYAKEIIPETKIDDYLDSYLDSIAYNKIKIKELMDKYDFPESYNFVNATEANVHVKNQKNCGSCWAMAATTSLAYRFHKRNIEVDLSPQHELSCYFSDCEHGNNVIDPQLSLIKNGTIEEKCLPYSSGDKIIEKCPANNICKNTSIPYKKYYAKNAYAIGISEENFYDVTAIIMDQLITKGPVVTIITAYDDFQEFGYDKNCTNKVYTYDGVSGNGGGHLLSIVGYGLLDGKYYWLLQNSWGDKWCNDGFVKVEFGQVGVGTIGLSEPFIEEEEESTEIIDIKYVNQDLACELEINADNFNLSNWTNPLNIIFSHENGLHDFNYICGVNKLITEGEEKIYCYYEYMNSRFYKGLYKYKSFQSIGKGNNFILDNAFKELKFNYYGNDQVFPLSVMIQGKEPFNKYYFVSEKGSRISFLFKTESIDQVMAPLAANDNHLNNPLSNCNNSALSFEKDNQRYILSYCDIEKNELDYFYDYSPNNLDSMLLRMHCGINIYLDIITYRLDKNKYPIFRIKHFTASYDYQSTITALLLSDIEGSVSEYGENKNNFFVLVSVETSNKNYEIAMICPTGNPKKVGENYAILCSSEFEIEDRITNITLYPYYGILLAEYPFEIIINETMKSEDFIPPSPTPTPPPTSTPTPSPTPDIGKYLELSSLLMALIIYIFI
jgi:C1A family cysteine protease